MSYCARCGRPNCAQARSSNAACDAGPATIVAFQNKQEQVDHPAHYNYGKIEVIDAIEDWQLGFHEGNVVKYVARAAHKGKPLQDLQKAQWYLNRLIERVVKDDD